MTVYLSSAEKASCSVTGCGCAERVPRYPWDMTDAEWEVLGPQARAVMVELRRGPGGRLMVHRLRVVVDAIRYVISYGIEWRGFAGGLPALAGGVRVVRTVERPRSAPAAGRPAAGGGWAPDARTSRPRR